MKIYSFLKKAYNKLCYIFKEIYVSAHLRAYYRETKALVGIKDEKIDCDYCEIVVVAFNNAKVIEYQIRTLQKYFRTPYRYTVFDNSTDTQVAKTIREVCQQYGIGYVRLPKQSFLSGGAGSLSHGIACNWIFKNFIQQHSAAQYVALLDHDIFCIEDFHIDKILDKQPFYGHVFAYGRKGIKYLWPDMFERTCLWFEKHNVKTAIFTSSQTADLMRERFPEMNILYCSEGVDTSKYYEGSLLKDRGIDLLEFGRSNKRIFSAALPERLNHVCTNVNGKYIYSNEQLFHAMADSKITITLPRCDTQPEKTGRIETLTQRYWEAMLSQVVMLGRAPKELVDLVSYNPVITLDAENVNEQILDILEHIEDYQPLVDRNRETALKLGDWALRMKMVMEWLEKIGYKVKE